LEDEGAIAYQWLVIGFVGSGFEVTVGRSPLTFLVINLSSFKCIFKTYIPHFKLKYKKITVKIKAKIPDN